MPGRLIRISVRIKYNLRIEALITREMIKMYVRGVFKLQEWHRWNNLLKLELSVMLTYAARILFLILIDYVVIKD